MDKNTRNKKAYQVHKDARIAYQKAYDVVHRETKAAYMKAYREEHPEVSVRASKKYHILYPERQAARNVVKVALTQGVLIQLPCVVCGDINSEAHHEDYSKPLEVEWLCHLHHVERRGMRHDG